MLRRVLNYHDNEAELAIQHVIYSDEGGWRYTNYRNDPGGPTYGGASFKWFNKWYQKYLAEGETFTQEQFISLAFEHSEILRETIKSFYYSEFYAKLNLDKLPVEFRTALLSCAVNIDPLDAGKLLQKAYNTLAKQYLQQIRGSKATFLVVDGVIGPKTVRAIENLLKKSLTKKNPAVQITAGSILKEFIINWLHHYVDLVIKDRNQVHNLDGWINRATKYCQPQ